MTTPITLAGRRFAEEQMIDSATITAPGDDDVLYECRCWVRSTAPGGSLEYIDGGDTERRRIDFPHDTLPQPGQIVEITESADPALTGVRFRIVSVSSGSFVRSRKCWCEALS